MLLAQQFVDLAHQLVLLFQVRSRRANPRVELHLHRRCVALSGHGQLGLILAGECHRSMRRAHIPNGTWQKLRQLVAHVPYEAMHARGDGQALGIFVVHRMLRQRFAHDDFLLAGKAADYLAGRIHDVQSGLVLSFVLQVIINDHAGGRIIGQKRSA